MTPLRSLGRIVLLLTAAHAAVAALPQQPEPPSQATASASDARITRLKLLVERAEAAVKAEDWDAASDTIDEAEVLMADWPEALLKRPDVDLLLKRIHAMQSELDESTEDTQDGLKEKEEVVSLTGEDLRAELRRVASAEAGVTYDFPIDLNDKVATWVHLFTTSKRGFMEGSLARGSRYLPMVRQVFAEEGVPQDLAFLAVPESGFKNTARSRAKAVGMWQFIPSTGRIFGLASNAWLDERCDPVKAARAAARYLKKLYESRGDWYLALAGYNAGPLNVDRAVAAVGTKNYWDLCRSRYLRTETKNYVPEICAAILIGRNPEKYGLSIPQMPPYAYETVDVDRMTSLQVLARFAGTDVESLKDLNPELLRGSTPPGRYELRVPPGQGLAMMRALANIPASQRLDFKSYVVRKGDTLAKVAARFKVAPEDLLQANSLTKAGFKAGRKILVPPAPTVPVDARTLASKPADVAPTRPLEPIPTIPALETSEPAATQPPKAAPAADYEKPEPVASAKPEPVRSSTHVVKRGETLFSIAQRYGVDAASLKKWNKLKGNKIQVGQKLKLQK